MGYTHFEKVSGENGLAVGAKGSEVVVAGSTGTLYQNGTAITSTAAELNALDGITATVAELNRSSDISARVVTTTATALSLTVTQHAEAIVVINSNTTVANTFTLPVAAGTGAKFTMIINTPQTQGSIVVAANGTTDVVTGVAYMFGTTAVAAEAFITSATSDKISFNASTTGGLGGDKVEAVDIAANTWAVAVHGTGSGTLATPFSAT